MESNRPRLRRSAASVYLMEKHGIPVAVTTLNKYASIGGGPVMQYAGRIPLYRPEDLDAWAEQRLSKPVTSTAGRERRSISKAPSLEMPDSVAPIPEAAE